MVWTLHMGLSLDRWLSHMREALKKAPSTLPPSLIRPCPPPITTLLCWSHPSAPPSPALTQSLPSPLITHIPLLWYTVQAELHRAAHSLSPP